MRIAKWALAVMAVLTAACNSGDSRVGATRAAEIDKEVRSFAATVAHDITHDGPSAWRRFFVDTPAFFMASDGRLVFADSVSATAGIKDLGRSIKQIELQWGPDMKVDPLAKDLAALGMPYHEIRTDSFGEHVDQSGYFTAVAEYRGGQWQFRDAHWSAVAHPPAGR